MKKYGCGVILLLSALLLSGCNGRLGLGQLTSLGEMLSPSHNAQEDCGFVMNFYRERISWKNKTPIVLSIHESVPAEFYPAIQAAMKDWETVLGRPIFQIREFGAPGPLDPRQDGVNLIYYMKTWEDSRSVEQARTSVYWTGDEIREADVRINAKDFSFYVKSPKDAHDVHMESLMVHELGHVLGLRHRDSGGSVMATYLAAQTERDSIGKTDVDSIRCEY